jgi:hypothetical protein
MVRTQLQEHRFDEVSIVLRWASRTSLRREHRFELVDVEPFAIEHHPDTSALRWICCVLSGTGTGTGTFTGEISARYRDAP